MAYRGPRSSVSNQARGRRLGLDGRLYRISKAVTRLSIASLV